MVYLYLTNHLNRLFRNRKYENLTGNVQNDETTLYIATDASKFAIEIDFFHRK